MPQRPRQGGRDSPGYLVQNLIPSIGEVILIGVKIGTMVELTNVTIIMIIKITGLTIRSIFVKLEVRM